MSTSDVDTRLRAIPLRHANLPHGRISYRDLGDGEPVVCLHGISSSSGSWLMQFETLCDRYRFIAWDTPGYGESTPLDGAAPTMEKYQHALRNFLSFLEIQNFHLVAHSLGALFAAAYCRQAPTPPQSLTFIAPTLGYGALPHRQREEKVQHRIELLKKLGVEQYASERGPKLLSKNAPHEMQEIVRWNMRKLHQQGYCQAARLLGAGNLEQLAEAVAAPVLVLCGSADEIAPEHIARRVQAAYPDAEYHSLPGFGHAAHIEAWPLVNKHLLAHFQKAAASGKPKQPKNATK